jgi:hydrogenase nickel incorporation protein HypA/HybF
MHEMSLSSAIVATVAKHAGGRPVKSVKLRVGALRQVVPESLEFYFDLVARDTVCEGARLEQEFVPGHMQCACGHEWDLEIPSFRCPSCGAGNATLVSGEEFEVESIIVKEGKQEHASSSTRA